MKEGHKQRQDPLKLKTIILISLAAVGLLAAVFLLPFLGGRSFFSPGIAPDQESSIFPGSSQSTSTPFKPQAATSTYLPTDYPTSTPTPTPTPRPEIVNPTRNKAVTSILQPQDQVNILLLGSDLLPNGAGFRTDVIILVTVNKADKTVSVTSFPRDLYLYIPGWTDQRINTAYPHGGFNTLKQTFSHNFGVSPDYFILINLWSFEYIVNDLGGININVPRTVCDNNWSGTNYHCVYAGTQHLYGKEALWYVRTRKTTNDFDRNVRQQLALEAILDRFFSLDIIGKIPDLYGTYKENVVTNLDLGTVLDLVPTALKLKDQNRITQYYINDSVVTDWVTPGGAQVLLPNYAKIRSILKQALNSPYAE